MRISFTEEDYEHTNNKRFAAPFVDKKKVTDDHGAGH